MSRPQSVQLLLGETAREIGILILVFAPLESVFGERRVASGFLMTVMVLGAALIACGILLETRD